MMNDLRYGFRMLLNKPSFALAAIVAVALGIGANTTIFSIVNAVLLRPLPLAEPERLVTLFGTFRGGIQGASVSPADFLDYRAQNQVFEQLAAAISISTPLNLTGMDEPERLLAAVVTTNYFDTLGVQPAVGRGFLPEDEREQDQVVVLSHGLWKRRFGGDPQTVGRRITLNGKLCTIVGVMPPGFRFPRMVDFWTALPFSPPGMKTRSAHFLRPVARLKPGVSLERAQMELNTIAARLEQQYPDSNALKGMRLMLLHEQLVGNTKQPLLVMMGAVGFVLLISCANVASLLLTRATSRNREMAIRAALGASRRRIMRLFLTESLLVSVIGGACGVLLALWGTELVVRMNPPNVPRLQEATLDGPVLIFSLLLSLLTGLVCGLMPALQASRPNLNASLKEGSRQAGGGLRIRRLHGLLVVSELALALVLLIGAGLMIQSFQRLLQVSPGFNPDKLLTLQISLSQSRYTRRQDVATFFERITQAIETLPGVESVGMVSTLPLGGLGSDNPFTIVERPPQDPRQKVTADFRVVDHRYFQTMGIPLIKGRNFTVQEVRAGASVFIISQTMAQRFFANENPLGKHLAMDAGVGEIVGVVGDVRQRALNLDAYQMMYVPSFQERDSNLVVRTAVDPLVLARAVRSQILAVDKDQPVSNIRTVEELLFNSLASRRLTVWLLGIFSAVALILAAVGIYGVISYSVSRRTHEIGIRMALGGQPQQVFRLVLGQGLALTALGLAIGVAAALGLSRVLSGLLFEVSASDPLTFALLAVVLAVIALLACYFPARRATKVDPIAALRYE